MAEYPESIGRYRILTRLGEGAMGVVYQARDPVIGRLLAIKTLRTDTGMTEEQYQDFTRRFIHEARIAGTLSHPNIVTLYDIGQDRGQPFIAMEYLEGRSLQDELDTGQRFSTYDVVMLLSQVARGLDYAHSRKVVHRDVKPGNIMIQPGNKVKLMDFGIAKIPGTRNTQTGVFLGSPSYTSPEQIVGDGVDWRADIFSLGVVAFEICTGHLPFPGENITTILYRIVHDTPVFPERISELGYLEDRWRETFTRVLDKNRNTRYQSAEDFAEALKDCVKGQDPSHRLASRTDDLTLKGEVFLQRRLEGEEAAGSGAPAPGDPESAASGGTVGETEIDLSRQRPPDVFRDESEVPDNAGEIDLRFRPQVPGTAAATDLPTPDVGQRRKRISALRIILALLLVSALAFAGLSAALYLDHGLRTTRDAALGLETENDMFPRSLSGKWLDTLSGVSDSHLVRIASSPSGALIRFDTRDTGRRTPVDLTLHFAADRLHVFCLELPDHRPARAVFKPGEAPPSELLLTLERNFPEVTLETEPPGARVLLDGTTVEGTTPLKLALDGDSVREVTFEFDGYRSARHTAQEILDAGGVFRITLPRIPKPGRLVIRSPFPVTVSSDSGETSVRNTKGNTYQVNLPGGSQTLTIRNRRYFHYEKKSFAIPEGGETVHRIPATGEALLKAVPSNCKIYVDGAYVDYAPVIGLRIAAGVHRARFVWPASGSSRESRFTVRPGEPVEVMMAENQ